jgi:hypothetical protein
MRFIGSIPLPSPITQDRWNSIVEGHPQLTPTDSIQFVKPYSDESDTITAVGALAILIVDDQEAGAFHWWKEGNAVDVFGDRDEVSSVANGLAKELGSSFHPLPKSPPPRDSQMAEYPQQVQAFHDALRRFVAVADVDTGLNAVDEIETSAYSLPGEFGDLPHALLRRTDGGLPNEAWANTEFTLSRDDSGWLTLEFIAWWVRDLSRSGDQIQLRPIALPPKAFDVQLGHTLKFIIDHFVITDGESPTAMLDIFAERAESLSSGIDDYSEVLGDLVRT